MKKYTATVTRQEAWAAMVVMEPALGDLEREIKQSQPPKEATTFWPQWEGYLSRIKCYAGNHARRAELREPECLEVAVGRLFVVYDDRADELT